jgi:two-component system, NtrC family, response regulator GlrR
MNEADPDPERRLQVTAALRPSSGRIIRQFSLQVTAGPSVGRSWQGGAERCTVGSHPSNELVIDDPTVSRFHCELAVAGDRIRVRDLGSRNGTLVGEASIQEATIADRATLVLGHTKVRVAISPAVTEVAQSARTQLGPLIGASEPMRELFLQIERVAATDATVLIEGETGSGKEGVVEAIHGTGGRSEGPLIVVDCSSLPGHLIEAELFGYEPTHPTHPHPYGAPDRRPGALESAHGGILFLDEIGELPAELQPRLLRVIESREFRRIGGSTPIKCEVRIVAATNRDLRREVNRGAFRADLYYRLAVVRLAVPPLRARLGDIPLLVEHFLQRLGAHPEMLRQLTAEPFLAELAQAPWPGNVRELRNHVEQCLAFGEARLPAAEAIRHGATVAADAALAGADAPSDPALDQPLDPALDQPLDPALDQPLDPALDQPLDPALDPAPVPYEQARRRALEAFERSYLRALLKTSDDNVARAAREAGVNRAYLHRLLRRHGLR